MKDVEWFVSGDWPHRRWALIATCVARSDDWRQVRIAPQEPALKGLEHWMILPLDEGADLDAQVGTWGTSTDGPTLIDETGAIWRTPRPLTLIDACRHRLVHLGLAFALAGASYAGWVYLGTLRSDAAKGAALQFAYDRDDGFGLVWETRPRPGIGPRAVLIRHGERLRTYLPK